MSWIVTDNYTMVNLEKVDKIYIWHKVSDEVYEVTAAFDPVTDYGENEVILSTHQNLADAQDKIKWLMNIINHL